MRIFRLVAGQSLDDAAAAEKPCEKQALFLYLSIV